MAASSYPAAGRSNRARCASHYSDIVSVSKIIDSLELLPSPECDHVARGRGTSFRGEVGFQLDWWLVSMHPDKVRVYRKHVTGESAYHSANESGAELRPL